MSISARYFVSKLFSEMLFCCSLDRTVLSEAQPNTKVQSRPNILLALKDISVPDAMTEYWIQMQIHLLTAIWLTPGGSSTVHIYTQTVHITMQLIWEECGPWPVFASYTLTFALQLRKSTKNLSEASRRVPVGTMKTEYSEQNIHKNKNI